MPTEFKIPELGENVTAGDVVRILVKAGDTLAKDQPVLELETDKATIEVPSDVGRHGQRDQGQAGDKVKVGQLVLTLDDGAARKRAAKASRRPKGRRRREAPSGAEAGGEAPKERRGRAEADRGDGGMSQKARPQPERAGGGAERGAGPSRRRSRGRAAGGAGSRDEQRRAEAEARRGRRHQSRRAPAAAAAAGRRPTAAARARAAGGAVGPAHGARARGRHRARWPAAARAAGSASRTCRRSSRRVHDGVGSRRRRLRRAPQAAPLPDFSKWGEVERKPMSNIRRKTAEHLGHAWNAIPHVTQHDKADITALEALRKQYAPQAEKAGGKLTMTAIALKIVAGALQQFPQFNASIDQARNEIVYKKSVHVGVAADTERGLLVPVDPRRRSQGHLRAVGGAGEAVARRRAPASCRSTRCRAAGSRSPISAASAAPRSRRS